MAAKTCVESVRWVPRALSQPRALQVLKKVSRSRWAASWASKRQRKSCNRVKSKPGSCQVEAEGILPIHAAPDGIGRLPISEAFEVLHDHHEG